MGNRKLAGPYEMRQALTTGVLEVAAAKRSALEGVSAVYGQQTAGCRVLLAHRGSLLH
jgi:hypothetical protein